MNIIARRTGKDVNSHTVLDGIITTIMATIQRINIIGSREGSRNRRRLKANQTGKKFRVGIKSNISTNRNNLISGVEIGRAVQQECRDRSRMPSSARNKKSRFLDNCLAGLQQGNQVELREMVQQQKSQSSTGDARSKSR